MHDVVYFQLKMNHSSAKSWSFHGFSFQMKIENQEKWAKLVTVFLKLNALVIFLKVNQKLVLSNSITTCYRTFRDTKIFFTVCQYFWFVMNLGPSTPGTHHVNSRYIGRSEHVQDI